MAHQDYPEVDGLIPEKMVFPYRQGGFSGRSVSTNSVDKHGSNKKNMQLPHRPGPSLSIISRQHLDMFHFLRSFEEGLQWPMLKPPQITAVLPFTATIRARHPGRSLPAQPRLPAQESSLRPLHGEGTLGHRLGHGWPGRVCLLDRANGQCGQHVGVLDLDWTVQALGGRWEEGGRGISHITSYTPLVDQGEVQETLELVVCYMEMSILC